MAVPLSTCAGNAAIRWGSGKWVAVSSTLIERYVGLELIAEKKWRVYYRDVLLGYLDEEKLRILDDQGRLHRASVNDVIREV